MRLPAVTPLSGSNQFAGGHPVRPISTKPAVPMAMTAQRAFAEIAGDTANATEATSALGTVPAGNWPKSLPAIA